MVVTIRYSISKKCRFFLKYSTFE